MFAGLLLPAVFVIIIGLTGCARKIISPGETGQNVLPSPEIVGKPGTGRTHSDSRMIASHSLVMEGYALLIDGNFDGAIRILERAVGLNPSDGTGYYYLAESWIGEKDYKLALQFNRLACMYLRANRKWTDCARIQKKKIEELIKQKENPGGSVSPEADFQSSAID